MAQLISSLHATGTAVLMSTHDNDEAQTLSHRVGLMQGARLAAAWPSARSACSRWGWRMLTWK